MPALIGFGRIRRRARRALVAIVVGSVLVGAVPALPAIAGGPVRVVAREVVTAIDGPRTVELPIDASHVALYWRGEHDAEVTVAFRNGGAFGQAEPVEHDEVGAGRRDGVTYGSVMVAGGARAIRVTADRPLARLTVLALDGDGDPELRLGFAGASAAAAVAQPAVTTRAGWGADESLRFNADGSQKWTPAFYPVQKLIVHHTATKNADPDPAATVRSIYYYHAITQGWGDIGYNFLVDESGRIYEGRYSRLYAAGESPTGEDLNGNGVTAAHVSGYNSGTVGIALLGTLTNVDATAAARDATERILAWKADRHGIDPHGAALYTNPVNGTQRTFANISGHRDLAATECPGGAFYNSLPAVRDGVAARIGSGETVTQTVPGAPTLSGSAARDGIRLSWTLPADGGSPITGYRVYRATGSAAPVLLTQVTATTRSYTDGSAARRQTYTYTVSAVNAIGEGSRSNGVTLKAR